MSVHNTTRIGEREVGTIGLIKTKKGCLSLYMYVYPRKVTVYCRRTISVCIYCYSKHSIKRDQVWILTPRRIYKYTIATWARDERNKSYFGFSYNTMSKELQHAIFCTLYKKKVTGLLLIILC